MSESKWLEPGAVIRADIDHEGVKLLAERLYGISVLELTELNGYDDKNYLIKEDPNVKNPLIMNHCADGYVLKILNSMDSRDAAYVEAQNELMSFLGARGVVCPSPVRNVFGQLHSLESIAGRKHVVRLLRYVAGQLLKDVPRSEQLFYQLGEFVANLDNKLQTFNHSGLEGHEHMWMLSMVPRLDKFKYVVTDAGKLDLVEEVIEEFKYAVVPRLEELEKGVIHGDVNEMNVLVGPKPGGRAISGRALRVCAEILEGVLLSKSEYSVRGIIDFGDVQHSCVVFELAIAMTYAMLLAGDPAVGGLVLAGYSVTRRVPDHEYRLLKTLISARLVQSLVLGAYTAQQDPGNSYVLSTEKADGWRLLRAVRAAPPTERDDPTDWKAIATAYLTRS